MLKNENVTLRRAVKTDKLPLFELLTADDKWTRFNGPYIPYKTPALEEFEADLFRRLSLGNDALVIDIQGKAIGTVTFYWEDERTRWLEVGVIIYASNMWEKGIGRKALVSWVTHLFNTREIERVGLTTWSGNPRMIACANSIGMQIEARLRKVRYYEGKYYDSVKLGVLKEEWFGSKQQSGVN